MSVGGRHVVGLLGAAGVALGLAVGVAPGLVAGLPGGPALTGLLAEAEVTMVMLLGGLLAVGIGLAAVRGAGARTVLHGPTDAGERFNRAVGRGPGTGRPPESPDIARTQVLGDAFERQVQGARAGDDAALAAVREALRERVVATLEAGTHEPAAAREAVAAGTWTDDPIAAGFLAAPDGMGGGADGRGADRRGGDGGGGNTGRRGRAWQRGPPVRERIERTVAALEGIEEGRP